MKMWEKAKHVTMIAVAAAMVLGVSPVLAVDIPGPSVQVTATVSSNLTFSATITELINNGQTIGPIVTAMDFGTLASNGNTPTGQPRALNSTKAFQVFFGVNAQGRPFSVKQTAGPLQSGGNMIPNGAFIVTPLVGVGGDPTKPLPGNIVVGARTSAVGTDVQLFSSAGGPADTMAATYGITDDPNLGSTAAIPLDQTAGSYVTTITYTATIT